MKAVVKNWGNSLGLRLPKKMCDELDIIDGTEIEIEIRGNRIVIVNTKLLTMKNDRVLEAIELLEESLPERLRKRKHKVRRFVPKSVEGELNV